MTTLLFVRHGATEWTRTGRLQGGTDIGLSDAGRRDVAALAPLVAAWAPTRAIVSPLVRTRATAELLGWPDAVADARFAEAGLGEWEGCTPDEIGADYAQWRAGELVPPGGEDLELVRQRVGEAALEATRDGGPVLVVTHGGVIRAALARFVGLDAARLVPVAAPSLTALDLESDGTARLRTLNAGAPHPVP